MATRMLALLSTASRTGRLASLSASIAARIQVPPICAANATPTLLESVPSRIRPPTSHDSSAASPARLGLERLPVPLYLLSGQHFRSFSSSKTNTNGEILPPHEKDGEILPPHEKNGGSKSNTNDEILPSHEKNGEILPPHEKNGEILPPPHEKNGEILPPLHEKIDDEKNGEILPHHKKKTWKTSDSNSGIVLPHHKKTWQTSNSNSGIVLPDEKKVITPFTGVIRPDLGYFQAKGGISDGPRLPVVRQVSFHEEGDIYLTPYETPMVYLRRVPSFEPAEKNPLIERDNRQCMMHTAALRILWKSAADLVTVNRLRGYCISRALVEENLVVSRVHGTFALKRPIADDLPALTEDFVGFKALKRLFMTLMEKCHGPGVPGMFMPDIHDWLSVLDDPYELDLAANHAWMVPDIGRAWLSVKIAQLLTQELKARFGKFERISQNIFLALAHLSFGIDDMHEFFKEWHINATTTRDYNMAGWRQPDILPEEFEEPAAGRWVVMVNRHGVLHSHSWKLTSLAGHSNYTVNDVVGLLHWKLPLYLPSVQFELKQNQIWHVVDKDFCFPKVPIYPRA